MHPSEELFDQARVCILLGQESELAAVGREPVSLKLGGEGFQAGLRHLDGGGLVVV